METDRTKFIGGSDIAAVLGISPWVTPAELWLDKVEPRRAEVPETGVKRRGHRLEPYIVDMIREDFGLEIVARNERYRDSLVPYFAAEIDFEYRDEETGAIENGEIKTVHPFKAKDWGESETDQLPLHYLAQAQWGLGIKGRKRCRTFALIGDDLRPFVVERDEETIAAMRARAQEFWERYVLCKVRPPMDMDQRALAALRRLYPGTDGTEIEATADDVHWRAVLATAESRRDAYQKTIDGATAHLLDRMGSAALLRFWDGKAFRRKLIKRKGYTVEPAEYMDFRLVTMKEPKA